MEEAGKTDALGTKPLLRVLSGERQAVPPVWMMRQAGRYLPEYRAVREKAGGFLDLCFNPEFAADVTLQPVRRFGFDAAILFSDLLVPFTPMGLDFDFVKGEGPSIERPVRHADDVDRLRTFDSRQSLAYVLETIRLLRRELEGRVPLIGFGGAPFTLAAYAIEGGPSTSYQLTKTFMYSQPEAWHRLCERFASTIADYLRAQIEHRRAPRKRPHARGGGANVVERRHGWIVWCRLAAMRPTRASLCAALLFMIGWSVTPASAQTTGAAVSAPQTGPAQAPLRTSLVPADDRIPMFDVDLRGVFARWGQDPASAAASSTAVTNLAGSGFGGVAEATLYPWRGRQMALGIGGQAFIAAGSHAEVDGNGTATGREISRRLRGFAGQLSLNFGHRQGWSYLTAGMGPTSFDTYLSTNTPNGFTPISLNFGGGARWYNLEHLALNLDLRFYQTKPDLGTTVTAPRARKNVLVLSAGIGIK